MFGCLYNLSNKPWSTELPVQAANSLKFADAGVRIVPLSSDKWCTSKSTCCQTSELVHLNSCAPVLKQSAPYGAPVLLVLGQKAHAPREPGTHCFSNPKVEQGKWLVIRSLFSECRLLPSGTSNIVPFSISLSCHCTTLWCWCWAQVQIQS
jgi:hypothetical protein